MKKLLAIASALLLVACAGVVKIEGDQVINGRMAVKVPQAWNRIEIPGAKQPFESWTQEGMSLDQLRFWAGIKPGTVMVSPISRPNAIGEKAPRTPTYTAGMTPDQLVSLFEVVHAVDGSIVTTSRVQPATLGAQQGVRFEYAIVRKEDNVNLIGTGWVAVRNGDLFAATFTAPKLWFYPRLFPLAEGVIRSAQIRD
jgi:hypothetical protein